LFDKRHGWAMIQVPGKPLKKGFWLLGLGPFMLKEL
jgi:hypothetical protein